MDSDIAIALAVSAGAVLMRGFAGVGSGMLMAPFFIRLFGPIETVAIIIMMEIGFLTPPFGYNLFYLRGVAPPSIRMTDIYRSVIPFILLMLAAVGLCMAAPGIVLWLPEQLF